MKRILSWEFLLDGRKIGEWTKPSTAGEGIGRGLSDHYTHLFSFRATPCYSLMPLSSSNVSILLCEFLHMIHLTCKLLSSLFHSGVYYAVQGGSMLYKVVLTFDSVEEILKCDHSNETCRAIHFPVLLLLTCKLTFEMV